MREKWTMEQILRGQNQRAKQAGARHDLTMEQWIETLEYFDYRCAYCGGKYEVVEHYLPVHQAGTTASNCVPACLHCNIMKDRKGGNLTLYQNEKIIRFIENKGVKIRFHIHNYVALEQDGLVNLYCESCESRINVPGLSLNQAQSYINQYFLNTGFAYTA
jgi:hypothetical protein